MGDGVLRGGQHSADMANGPFLVTSPIIYSSPITYHRIHSTTFVYVVLILVLSSNVLWMFMYPITIRMLLLSYLYR